MTTTAPGRSAAASPPTTPPFISVLVPVRNESRFIADTLAQLFAQDYPSERYEIIVADGRSTDDTCAIVRAHDRPNLRLLDNPGRLSSCGRNVAIRAAIGDVLLLIDGHCQIDNPQYLREVADAFTRSGADTLGRPQPLDVRGATPLQRAIAAARSSRLGHHPGSHIWSDRDGYVPPQSVAVAYRREVFDRVGLFDEAFDACEDYELNHRVAAARMTCFLTPRVTVRYHPRESLAGLYRQLVRYGRGRVRLLRKHPATFSPAVFVPAVFLLGVVLGPLMALLAPALWPIYAGCLALYLAVVGGFSAALGWRDVRTLAWLPAVFATVHAGAAAGVLWELAFGRAPITEPTPASGLRLYRPEEGAAEQPPVAMTDREAA